MRQESTSHDFASCNRHCDCHSNQNTSLQLFPTNVSDLQACDSILKSVQSLWTCGDFHNLVILYPLITQSNRCRNLDYKVLYDFKSASLIQLNCDGSHLCWQNSLLRWMSVLHLSFHKQATNSKSGC